MEGDAIPQSERKAFAHRRVSVLLPQQGWIRCGKHRVPAFSTLGFSILAAFGLAACGNGEASQQVRNQGEVSQGDASPASSVRLGVQTHFSQGWPVGKLDLAQKIQVAMLRDSLAWPSVMLPDGSMTFTSENARKLDRACSRGFALILTTKAKHPSYDGGKLIQSLPAKEAFGRYVAALAAHYGSCLVAVEVGNEVNATGALVAPDGMDPFRNYVQIVAAAKRGLASRPDVVVLGGSSNQIATGFLMKLFDAGLLDVADAIAVHPYRNRYDGIDFEVARLRKKMRSAGREIPIWVTEFSPDTPDSALNGEQMLIGLTLMASAGIRNFVWYALAKQSWFPNMGLFDGARQNASGETFAFLQSRLLSRGPPVRIGHDPGLFVYRYGNDRLVVWGLRQTVTVPHGATIYDAQGVPTGGAGNILIDEHPRIILGASDVEPVQREDLADSLIQYGSGVWSYHAVRDGHLTELSWQDGNWDSIQADRFHKPLYIKAFSGAVAGAGEAGSQAVWRWTPATHQLGNVRLALCARKKQSGDGIELSVLNGDVLVSREVLASGEIKRSFPISLSRNTPVDVRVGPNKTSGGDTFALRVIVTTGDKFPECPAGG